MPKIALPTNTAGDEAEVEVVKSTIETLVNQVEYLLQGRIDKDNLIKDGGNYALVSADTVQDMASTVRPIGGVKMIANKASETDTFENGVFGEMITRMNENPIYQVISGKATKSFLNSDDEAVKENPSGFSIVIIKDSALRAVRGNNFINDNSDSDEWNLNRDAETVAYNLDVRANCNMTAYDRWIVLLSSINETLDSITFNFNVHTNGFDDGNFLVLDFEVFVLCERML